MTLRRQNNGIIITDEMVERFRSRYAVHTLEVLEGRYVRDCLEYVLLEAPDGNASIIEEARDASRQAAEESLDGIGPDWGALNER